jgi:CheY-like chemotaxis protein
MVARVLEDEGLTVLEAANGEEALRLAEKRMAGSIDLLLTDVVMPRMGGIELAEQFKVYHPDTRILLNSGYTDEAVIQHGALDPDTPFMQKPFLPIDLLHKVREVLEG